MNKFLHLDGSRPHPWAPRRTTAARSGFPGSIKYPMFDTGGTAADTEVTGRVQELAEKHGWEMSHVALAWINARVSSPTISFSSAGRMEEALGAEGGRC